MSEFGDFDGSPEEPSPSLDVTAKFQYGGSAVRWLLRKELYKYGEHPVNFYEETFAQLNVEQNDTILDVGCGDGRDIASLGLKHDLTGTLFGLDITRTSFEVGMREGIENGLNLQFIVGSGNALPFYDESIDKTLAVLMLHHSPNPYVALHELYRVTKIGGLVAIVTSDRDTKPKHNQFRRDIAKYLSILEPKSLTQPFDNITAQEMLPEWFGENISQTSFPDTLHIPVSGYTDLIDSVLSTINPFNGVINLTHTDMLHAAQNVINGPFVSETQENGDFIEHINHHLFVCLKTC